MMEVIVIVVYLEVNIDRRVILECSIKWSF